MLPFEITLLKSWELLQELPNYDYITLDYISRLYNIESRKIKLLTTYDPKKKIASNNLLQILSILEAEVPHALTIFSCYFIGSDFVFYKLHNLSLTQKVVSLFLKSLSEEELKLVFYCLGEIFADRKQLLNTYEKKKTTSCIINQCLSFEECLKRTLIDLKSIDLYKHITQRYIAREANLNILSVSQRLKSSNKRSATKSIWQIIDYIHNHCKFYRELFIYNFLGCEVLLLKSPVYQINKNDVYTVLLYLEPEEIKLLFYCLGEI